MSESEVELLAEFRGQVIESLHFAVCPYSEPSRTCPNPKGLLISLRQWLETVTDAEILRAIQKAHEVRQ